MLDVNSDRIFHLYRANKTERFISDYFSFELKDWVNYSDKLGEHLYIPVEMALGFKEFDDRIESEITERYLADYPGVMRVSYEDFIANKDYYVSKVVKHVGGSPIKEPKPSKYYKKQANKDMYRRIHNLHEIEEVFGTPVN